MLFGLEIYINAFVDGTLPQSSPRTLSVFDGAASQREGREKGGKMEGKEGKTEKKGTEKGKRKKKGMEDDDHTPTIMYIYLL